MVHHSLVLAALREATRQTARDRPEPLAANARSQSHRMGHQPADAAVPVVKWVNVVEAVMRGRDGNDARARPNLGAFVALFEIRHEVSDAI
jgi:hypothetical protein